MPTRGHGAVDETAPEIWDGPADPYAASSSPMELPLTYPGVWPERSVVITGADLWEIRDQDGHQLDWDAPGDARLGACRVAVDSASMARFGFPEIALPHLVSVLEESHAMSVDARIPVLAIGSNAAPSQLRHKFRDGSSPIIIPSMLARLRGVCVAYAAFQAPRGYIPATLVSDPDAQIQLAVQWLDRDLVRSLDATELPRYRRVWLDGEQIEIVLHSGERLPGVFAYIAVSGALGTPEDGPWTMAPDSVTDAGLWSRTRGMPQRPLVERLLRMPEVAATFGSTPEEFVAAVVGPDRSFELFRSLGLVLDEDPLLSLPDVRDADHSYGGLIPLHRDERRVEGESAVVTRTPDGLDRRGRSVVRLTAAQAARLGNPALIQLMSIEHDRRRPGQAPTALADVIIAPADGPPGDRPAPGSVEVDHVVRMAAGVGLGEPVAIRAVSLRRTGWTDPVLGRPNSVTMRVTLADPSTAERDVALMSALTLELLGVDSGDYVVLEGAAGPDGIVPTVTLKAFTAPDEVVAERIRVTGGVWGARFPGVRETLGVHPDIPLVFLDSAMRSRLGLTGKVLPTVRVRPARLQQFLAELREVAMILALTFIGIVVAMPIPWLGWVVAVILGAGAFAIVILRMRRRLSHVFTRRAK